MHSIASLHASRQSAVDATMKGPPARTVNPFFGVGPITDAVPDEMAARAQRIEFEHWLEKTYRKLDDKGNDLGPFTVAEMSRSMHRGYPADKVLLDMMGEIHRYFGFSKANKMAVGLGGGHSGFTVAALHLLTNNDPGQHVFIDTPAPESKAAQSGGFFRQSWGAQIVELMRYSKGGDEHRLHFTDDEGQIPSAKKLRELSIKIFFGVGHETTGATTYAAADIKNLLAWIDQNPSEHHAMLDATSMLGAMPWGEAIVAEAMQKCCFFMPFQKAIGGISGYYVINFTPHALALVETNQQNPSWAIPRQLKLAAPVDAKRPLSGERTVKIGPFYDPETNKMLGGVINTFSTLAFAETTFGLQQMEKRVGSVANLNQRSVANRQAINDWLKTSTVLEAGVADEPRRGAAVTLLKVRNADITDPATHARIIARSKQLLSYDGMTHPNGEHEKGLDVARYINAFPGTPGDYRAWIGGIRDADDIVALLENLQYAYLRAKVVVLEEELAKLGEIIPSSVAHFGARTRYDDPNRAYKVLICDAIGLAFDAKGKPDPSEVAAHVKSRSGAFHHGTAINHAALEAGKIHFFYQPNLSTEAELLAETADGHYDAVIAAATFIPKAAKFAHGGVRIGAGTGNMGSASWGGGNGVGGAAPLMNTPSFNSRATAQMAMKALLKVLPNLPVADLHNRVVNNDFDTGRNLREYPTAKLEGKKIAIIGYGNIGREMAKLAQGFGMMVSIYARPKHQRWIESEGFHFAETPEAAAHLADVVSPHTGLGPLDASTNRYANAGIINAKVLSTMKPGAIVINYDRGECVDAEALSAAMASGQISYASIDADIFKDEKTGALSGPMKPYLSLLAKFSDRLELLPHAAADTDHPSRVAGAKQAVDQIFECIHYRSVTNIKGDIPDGYTSGGAATMPAVGRVTANDIARAADHADQARKTAETMAAMWGSIATTTDPDRRAALIARHGEALVLAFNQHASLMRKLGLEGPYA